MPITDQKLVISGNIVEHDSYRISTFYGTTNRKKSKGHKTGLSTSRENELKSAYRAKSTVRHLVNANASRWYKPDGSPCLPIFITLTFEADVRDLAVANEMFTSFIQRLNYYIEGVKKNILRYLVVPEFQDENRGGVIHYHVLFFNLPYIVMVYDEMRKIWSKGNINVKSVRRVKDLGKYLTKYMVKSMHDGRLKGRKKYFTSKSLFKPHVYRDPAVVGLIITSLPKNAAISTFSWENEYRGTITRTIYNLNESPEALDKFRGLVVD